MVKSGLLLTIYIIASIALYVATLMVFSNTMSAFFLYGLILFPVYICALSACWTQIARSIDWKSLGLEKWVIVGLVTCMVAVSSGYGIVALVCAGWVQRSPKWTEPIPFRPWIWVIILPVQLAIIAVSPGNCYGWTQGKLCYSNIQLWVEHLPRDSSLNVPHWGIGDGAFVGMLLIIIHAVLLFFALRRKSVRTTEKLIH